MIMMMTMMMKRRVKHEDGDDEEDEDEDDDESVEGGVREGVREGDREKRGKEKRGETERQNTDMDPKHLCLCANHFQDHKRLLVPRYKQALSRRLQIPALTQKTCPTVRLFGLCFKTGRTRPEKTRARELVHRRRCSKWPPLARTHAKLL